VQVSARYIQVHVGLPGRPLGLKAVVMKQPLKSRIFMLALAGAGYALPAGAMELVKNGSLTQTNASGFLLPQNNDVPPQWQQDIGTVDVNLVGYNAGLPVHISPFPRYAVDGVTASPDGGSWVGMAHNPDPDPARFNDERFKQTVDGFVPGQTYAIRWHAANFGNNLPGTANDYLESNGIQVFIDGNSIGAGGTLDLSPVWVTEQIVFTATATQHVLMFGTRDAAKSYVSIDGISITPVPEPSSWALLAAGLLWIGHRGRHGGLIRGPATAARRRPG
jgi:hypothetical protein